jgi:hypothetical protein
MAMSNFIHWTLYLAAILYAAGAVGFFLIGNKAMAVAYVCYAVSNIALAQLA